MTNVDNHLSCINFNISDAESTFSNSVSSTLLEDVRRAYSRAVTPLQVYGITGDTITELLGYLSSSNVIISEFVRGKLALGDAQTLLFQNEVIRASIDVLVKTLKDLNQEVIESLSEQLSEASLYIYDRDLMLKDLKSEELEEQDKALIINMCLKKLFDYAFVIIPAVGISNGSSYKLDRITQFKKYSIKQIKEAYNLDITEVDNKLSKILI